MIKKIIIGIQGGRGSFNEEAILTHLHGSNIEYEIKYLYTSDKVLEEVENGKIDMGQFAVVNSLSGPVKESMEAMSKHNFEILDEYSIKIVQNLLVYKDTQIEKIKEVMSHPQSLAQCAKKLANRYSKLKQVVGKGKFIDHAYVAEMISKRRLPGTTATIGSKTLSDIYDLKIVEANLQDSDKNYTTFLLVKGMDKKQDER